MRASVVAGSLLLALITVAACRTVEGDPPAQRAPARDLPGMYVDRGRYMVRNGTVLLDDDDDGRIDEDKAHRLDIRGDSLRANIPWGASAAMRLAGLPNPILVRRARIGD